MVMRVNSCCFGCCDIRIGTYIIASLSLLSSVYITWYTSSSVILGSSNRSEWETSDTVGTAMTAINIVLMIAFLVCSILLLLGLNRNNAGWMFPWIVVTMIIIIVGIILGFVLLIMGIMDGGNFTHWAMTALVLFLESCFNIYCWLIVYTYYTDVKNGDVAHYLPEAGHYAPKV